jgi:hypothetical protein
MASVWGDWLFGEESSMAQLMTDWMSIDAFIVLSGTLFTSSDVWYPTFVLK